ncbi:hypothetical protein AALP_AAs74635U001300 [Arabis alpina]|uniref:Uncharacterized protein n=1 Tax=Arabis alpina TaxID=50452 RepID=A0A087G0C1_ARAAL|nr:hypothetical protein AALP_AAs74635U001300 [Arabis alpina]
MVRFNTTDLPVELDHLYAGAMVGAGDVEGSGTSPHDFVFEFRGERKHISQVPLAYLQFVQCVRGGADFLSPPRDDFLPSDPDVKFAMSAISMLACYNFLSDAWYASDKKKRKLNTQNGELVAESNRSLEARCKAEQELVKFKDLLDHSQRMNIDLIAEQDALNSRVTDLTSALAEAEEMKKKEVVGAIRRIEKATKDGVPVDIAKKEKLEARLAGYNAEAESIVLTPIPDDSSDDEEVKPARDLALDISYTESSDDEAERIDLHGRLTVAGKTVTSQIRVWSFQQLRIISWRFDGVKKWSFRGRVFLGNGNLLTGPRSGKRPSYN